MRGIIATFLFFISAAVAADPAPFGLEVGKITVAEVEKIYALQQTGINKYSNGPMYSVNVSQINFEGLKTLTLIFNKAGVLTGVLATLPKHQFKTLHQSLSKKYKVVGQQIPFVGNAYAKYVNGSTVITLDAPHMSFEMSMNYTHKELTSAYSAQSKAEAVAKKKSQESQL